MQAHHTHTLSRKLYSPGCKFCQCRKKKKNKQGAKTQRVDPPKFTTRMPKTSRCEKDGNALISPLNFSQSDHRLYLRIVDVNVTKRNFMVTDGDHHEFHVSDSRSSVISYIRKLFQQSWNASNGEKKKNRKKLIKHSSFPLFLIRHVDISR